MNAKKAAHPFPNFLPEFLSRGRAGGARLLISAFLLLAVLAPGAAAHAQNWAVAAKSRARLIDAGVINGARYAGIEIQLAGEAVTYWRDPGDAGTPPVFDFSASSNVAAAKALFPQPQRIDEDGADAFGYRHSVVFPVRVTLRDKDKPATLTVKLDYAVCDTICRPVQARLRAELPPGPQTSAPGALPVVQALDQVPRRLDAAQARAIASVASAAAAGGDKQWRLRILQGEARDVFVEAPEGFYFESKPAGEKGAFLLTLVEHPPKKTAPDRPIRVTVSGPQPVEFDLSLPPHGH